MPNQTDTVLPTALSIARPERVREQLRHLADAPDPSVAAERFAALQVRIMDAKLAGEAICAPEDWERWDSVMRELKARHGRVLIGAGGSK